MPLIRRAPSSSSSAGTGGKQGFAPPAQQASFKDLLLFEERLKQNAALLRSRKRKYEVFLVILSAIIVVLTHKSFLRPSPTPSLHYLHLALLPVAVVTLLLFFASGMYSERIGYANRYVPHANRALRSMNMHLNMRTASHPYTRFVPFPFSLLFPSAAPAPLRPSTRISATTGQPIPLPSIPPTKNPRGELIFSSRVERAFRDGYERYRALFERRRAERYHQLRASQRGLKGLWWRLLGYRRKPPAAASDGAEGRSSQRSSRTPSPSPSPSLAAAEGTPLGTPGPKAGDSSRRIDVPLNR